MNTILRQYDGEDFTTVNGRGRSSFHCLSRKSPSTTATNEEDIKDAIRRLAKALRDTLPLLTGTATTTTSESSKAPTVINAQWLFRTLKSVPSAFEKQELAKMVWDACRLPADQQEEALFAALGTSEEAMTALFDIFPHASDIANNITANELGSSALGGNEIGGSHVQRTAIVEQDDDPVELERQRLRQEAYDAAQVAAIAQAELDALRPSSLSAVRGQGGGGGATHSISRSSEIEAQKAARKAHKRAQQTMAKARAAGAIIDDDEFMSLGGNSAMKENTFGEGGLVGRSEDEIASLQQSLLPEGSRRSYSEKGLPHGTERYDDDVIGYEKVTIPPPRLDPSKLHSRLRIDDVLDPDCAKAFAGTSSLNPMQSTVFDTAFHRRENMLVCAPTGAGKVRAVLEEYRRCFLVQTLLSSLDTVTRSLIVL